MLMVRLQLGTYLQVKAQEKLEKEWFNLLEVSTITVKYTYEWDQVEMNYKQMLKT